jgi:uncharacterized membrane protein
VRTREDPSRWRDRALLALVAAVGLVISLYLAACQVGAVAAPWDPLFGAASSARVLHSVVARLLPVPDAAVGAAAYAAEIVLGLAGGAERWRRHPWLVLAFGAVAVGLGVVGVALTVVQVAVVRTGCTLCLASAAASIGVAVAVVAGGEVRAALHALHAAPAEGRRA